MFFPRTISWKNRSGTKWKYLQIRAWTLNHSSRFRVKHSYKARMKLQLDSSITNTSIKCHQVISQEILVDPISSNQKLFWMHHSELWKCLSNRNTLLAINRACDFFVVGFYEDTAWRARKWSCRYDFKYHWPHSEWYNIWISLVVFLQMVPVFYQGLRISLQRIKFEIIAKK